MMNDAQTILITGPAGSGKTFLSKKLKKDGVNAIDADSIRGLGRWIDKNDNNVEFPQNATSQWIESHKYVWDKNFLRSWLKEQTTVYLFGLAANIFEVADLFDKAFYLNPTPELLRKRFEEGKRFNIMGQSEEQREVVIKGLSDFAQKARRHGLTIIDADQTPDEIYKIIAS